MLWEVFDNQAFGFRVNLVMAPGPFLYFIRVASVIIYLHPFSENVLVSSNLAWAGVVSLVISCK